MWDNFVLIINSNITETFATKTAEKHNDYSPEIQSFRVIDSEVVPTGSIIDEAFSESKKKSCEYISETKSNLNYSKVFNISDNMDSQRNILMCFICKLSFGEQKSFAEHALEEHKIDDLNINLEPCKMELEDYTEKNFSAIIQKDSKDRATVCILEPLRTIKSEKNVPIRENNYHKDPIEIVNDHIEGQESDNFTLDDTISSFFKAIRKQIFKSNANIDGNEGGSICNDENTETNKAEEVANTVEEVISTITNSTNLLSLFQKFANNNIVRETDVSSKANNSCCEHSENQSCAVECKNCVILNLSKPSLNNNSTKSPQINSFTIGVCPEHINGRKLGVDCTRCELILNTNRIHGSASNLTSTRNSCKTLKCPQCNWHYKYQETLEIHMREKHPDGESACGYCLAGQPHPRLARGETYTCGYKPYRCEICNYSTTTKGNLSIHMQSDKHLNNMQEITNQQIGESDCSASYSAVKSPTPLSNISPSLDTVQSNILYQTSGRPNVVPGKTNFRCDVCSYETSVARNLRIHMTSEKHTNNISILEQNIKKLEIMSKLQSQNTDSPTSFLHQIPSFCNEKAIADISYNQALLIQFLQHSNFPSSNGK